MEHVSVSAKKLLADYIAVQIDSFTWNRFRLLKPYIVQGPVKILNIGTGGGVQSLRLLRAGNRVTAVEIDPETARRTQERVHRHGFEDRFNLVEGHILNVEVEGNYRAVWMTEVLEHIQNDHAVLKKIGSLLETGGRLVMSTPTASWGQLGGKVSIEEDGGHVRVGYEGEELDLMLRDVGLLTIRRIMNCNRVTQVLYHLEKILQHSSIWPVRYIVSLALRPLIPILDLGSFGKKWANQITVAKKIPQG